MCNLSVVLIVPELKLLTLLHYLNAKHQMYLCFSDMTLCAVFVLLSARTKMGVCPSSSSRRHVSFTLFSSQTRVDMHNFILPFINFHFCSQIVWILLL